MVCYYCCPSSCCCCQALNSKNVHHHHHWEWKKMMRMSVEYSPQSWEDSQSDAVNGLFLRREVDLTYNNDDEMVIMMKM